MATSGSCCRPDARRSAGVMFMVLEVLCQREVPGPGGFVAQAAGAQAQGLQRALVAVGECGTAHQQQSAAAVGLHGAQFFADQQTRQKAGVLLCGQGVEQSQRARGKDAGEHAGRALGQQHGLGKGVFVPGCIARMECWLSKA